MILRCLLVLLPVILASHKKRHFDPYRMFRGRHKRHKKSVLPHSPPRSRSPSEVEIESYVDSLPSGDTSDAGDDKVCDPEGLHCVACLETCPPDDSPLYRNEEFVTNLQIFAGQTEPPSDTHRVVFSKYFRLLDDQNKMMRELAGLRAQVSITPLAHCSQSLCSSGSAEVQNLAHFIAGEGATDDTVENVAHDLAVEFLDEDDDTKENLVSLLLNTYGKNIEEFLVCYSQAISDRAGKYLGPCRRIFEDKNPDTPTALQKLILFTKGAV